MTKEQDKPVVLHLARWYPHRYDPMFGLFVRRHIEAAALYTRPVVVYLHPDEQNISSGKYQITVTEEQGFPEIRVYYRSSSRLFAWQRFYRYFKAGYIGIKEAQRRAGHFDIVHVHVLTRTAIMALFLKKFRGIPYLITEHWSRYLPQTGNFKGFFRKTAARITVKHAAYVTTVSRNLASAMQAHNLKNNNYMLLPNVISPLFFNNYQTEKTSGKIRFVHVSCFEDRSKNVSGILRAVKKLSLLRNDFEITLIGEGMDFEKMKRKADELQIPHEIIKFTGLLEGEQLAEQMARGDLLVVFSNYENMPVVINESFALGIPVVATRVGGIPEVVSPGLGILIDPGDENALVNVLNDFADGKYRFHKTKLVTFAKENFSYEAVGKKMKELYFNVLHPENQAEGEVKSARK